MRSINGNGGGALDGLMAALAAHGGVDGLRSLAPLPRHTEDVLDGAVIGVGRQRLALVDDILSAGLIYRLDNWMSVMSLTYQQTTHAGYAQRSMMPDARGENAVPDRSYVSLPIFCTWEKFAFGIRELLASERAGAPLDTTMITESTRNVNEAIEDQAINGAGLQVNGLTADGALTNPANTFTYTGNEAWNVVGHTGEEIVADVQSGIDVAVADNFYGPWNLYIPRGYASKMAQDYKSATSGTIQQRILELPGISSIKVLDYLPANRTLLVQMSPDVVDVVVGQTPAVVSWTDGPDWNRFWCVLACMIVRWKANAEGGVGYVVGNTT